MRKIRRPLFILLLVLGASAAGWYFFTFAKSSPLPLLPNPNGYDDFVKAGQMLSGDDLPDFQSLRDMDSGELRTALTNSLGNHAESLALAKVGLIRECHVRLDYVATSSVHLKELSAIKNIARVFISLGRLAEFEGRNAAASEFYLDLIRLGHESARGGVKIDSMSGHAIEAVGLEYLEKLVPDLDAKTCREAASALESINGQSEPIEAVIHQEKEWMRRAYGLKGQFMWLLTYRSRKEAERAWAGKMKAQHVRRQSLVIKLAMRAYELDIGRAAESLDQLVPKYLRHMPEGLLIPEPAAYRMQHLD